MAHTFPIGVELRGRDRASGPISRALGHIHGATSRLTGGIGRAMGVLLNLKTAFVGLATGTVALKAAEAFKSYLDVTGELVDFSRQVGIGVEALQELRYAAEQLGTGTETLDHSLALFAKNLGLARAGAGPLRAFLQRVSPDMLRAVTSAGSMEEALEHTFAAMSQIEDPAKRAALATQVFGRSGAKMTRMVAEGIPELKRLREEKRAYGLVSQSAAERAEAFGDDINRVKHALQGVAQSLAGQLLPVMEPYLRSLATWIAANRQLIGQKLDVVVRHVADALKWISTDGLASAARGVAWFREHWDAILVTVKALAAVWIAGKLAGAISGVITLGGQLLSTLRAAAEAGGKMTASMTGLGLATAGAITSITSAVVVWRQALKEYEELKSSREALAGIDTATAEYATRAGKRLGISVESLPYWVAAPTLNLRRRWIESEARGWGIETKGLSPERILAAIAEAKAAGDKGRLPIGETKIVIDFKNMPKGVIVEPPKPGAGLPVETNVGRNPMAY